MSRDSATHHRAEAQVIGLRVGHNAATERTRRGEATLQPARGTEGAHAAGIPAAMHVRMCRMQTTGKVSMLRWNQTRRKAQGAQVSHLRMRMRHKCRLLLHSSTYPLRPRSRRQSPWMDRVAWSRPCRDVRQLADSRRPDPFSSLTWSWACDYASVCPPSSWWVDDWPVEREKRGMWQLFSGCCK